MLRFKISDLIIEQKNNCTERGLKSLFNTVDRNKKS